MKQTMLVITGAVLGGLLGYAVFFWLISYGLYALILPGALVGLGASLFSNRSLGLAVGCGVLALALGIVTEWRSAPFVKDRSLGFFLTHLQELSPVTLVMIGVGGIIGFAGPFSQYRRTRNGKPTPRLPDPSGDLP